MSVVSFVFPSYSSNYIDPESIHCNDPQSAQHHESHDSWAGLTCVIRTDADVATEVLRRNVITASGLSSDIVSKVINTNYEKWGKAVVGLIGEGLDYSIYGPDIKNNSLKVHFFRSAQSSKSVVANAMDLLRGHPNAQDGKYLMISLDDMIQDGDHNFIDFAFSRKFDVDGIEELGYIARPGAPHISEQISAIKNKVDQLFASSGGSRVPIVLLEDNIRRSKMINWVIEQFTDAGVFENGHLAGISTCFCSADIEERRKIEFEGKSIPVLTVAQYSNKNSDVITPRDLFFDGYVVEIDGHVGRLPALFMDVTSRFKIKEDQERKFKAKVAQANIDFCVSIKNELDVDIPLSWMEHGETIAKAINVPLETKIVDVMKAFLVPNTHNIVPQNNMQALSQRYDIV